MDVELPSSCLVTWSSGRDEVGAQPTLSHPIPPRTPPACCISTSCPLSSPSTYVPLSPAFPPAVS